MFNSRNNYVDRITTYKECLAAIAKNNINHINVVITPPPQNKDFTRIAKHCTSVLFQSISEIFM